MSKALVLHVQVILLPSKTSSQSNLPPYYETEMKDPVDGIDTTFCFHFFNPNTPPSKNQKNRSFDAIMRESNVAVNEIEQKISTQNKLSDPIDFTFNYSLSPQIPYSTPLTDALNAACRRIANASLRYQTAKAQVKLHNSIFLYAGSLSVSYSSDLAKVLCLSLYNLLEKCHHLRQDILAYDKKEHFETKYSTEAKLSSLYTLLENIFNIAINEDTKFHRHSQDWNQNDAFVDALRSFRQDNQEHLSQINVRRSNLFLEKVFRPSDPRAATRILFDKFFDFAIQAAERDPKDLPFPYNGASAMGGFNSMSSKDESLRLAEHKRRTEPRYRTPERTAKATETIKP